MTDNTLTNKLELHYYFSNDDKTHSMDAVIRNKCEYELLQIISTISKELNVQIKTETEAYRAQNAYLKKEGQFLRFGETLAFTTCAGSQNTFFTPEIMK